MRHGRRCRVRRRLVVHALDQGNLRGHWLDQRAPTDIPPPSSTPSGRLQAGETIHLVGILRLEEHGPEGGVAMWRTGTTANYQVTAPRGIQVAEGEVKVGPAGHVQRRHPHRGVARHRHYQFVITLPNLFGPDQFFSAVHPGRDLPDAGVRGVGGADEVHSAGVRRRARGRRRGHLLYTVLRSWGARSTGRSAAARPGSSLPVPANEGFVFGIGQIGGWWWGHRSEM